jgi:hypothetical protein
MDKKLPVHLVFENVARLIYTKGVGRGNLSMLNRNPERARRSRNISIFWKYKLLLAAAYSPHPLAWIYIFGLDIS